MRGEVGMRRRVRWWTQMDAERLRLARHRDGYTLVQLAALLGVSHFTIAGWEAGNQPGVVLRERARKYIRSGCVGAGADDTDACEED